MALELADALRAEGLSVVEYPGWKGRGHGAMDGVRGVLGHHTAGPPLGNYPSLSTVVNGRPGLSGPLCNVGLMRDGTWICIAAGLAYHAGVGYLPFIPKDKGNNYMIGVEAESTGNGDWTVEQLVSYPKGVAAILKRYALTADKFAGHLEYAPTRKIDPALWPGGMNGFRDSVWRYLTGYIEIKKRIPEDPMYIFSGTRKALLSGPLMIEIGHTKGELDSITDATIRQGAIVQWVEASTFDDMLAQSKRYERVAP
jgi:hypothetical protein